MRVLIVEDNRDIAANIGDFLEARGHESDFALDGLGGLHLAITMEYDAIVLDITLPGMDGLAFCRRLREDAGRNTPVLMLTARDTLDDKLAGFDAGADDYLVKPFELRELEARLGVLLKRGRPLRPERLCIGDLEIDLGRRVASRAGQPLALNRLCMTILIELAKASPNMVSRAELERRVWGDQPPASDTLRSHVYSLRRAVDKPFGTPLLHTIHGVGYRMAVEQ